MSSIVDSVDSLNDLRAKGFEYMPIWEEVKKACNIILQYPDNREIMTPEFFSINYHRVYRLASNECTKVPLLVRNHQERVHTKDGIDHQCLVLFYLLKDFLKDFFNGHVASALCNFSEIELLKEYRSHWVRAAKSIKKLCCVFKYLEGHWNTLTLQNNQATFFSTTQICTQVWYEVVLNPLKEKFTETLLGIVMSEVNGNGAQREELAIFSDVLRSFVELDKQTTTLKSTYVVFFEDRFLALLREYYTKCFKEKYRQEENMDLKEYLDYVSSSATSIESLAQQYMHKQTSVASRRTVTEALLPQHHHNKIASDVVQWISQGKQRHKDVELAYRLFDDCSSSMRDTFGEAFASYIAAYGKDEIAKLNCEEVAHDPSILGDTQVRVYREFEELIRNVFNGHSDVWKALERGTNRFVNENVFCVDGEGNVAATLLCRYFHSKLCVYSPLPKANNKKNNSSNSSSSGSGAATAARAASPPAAGPRPLMATNSNPLTSTQFTIPLNLLHFIKNKDVFQKAFQQLLMRRIVFTDVNINAETQLVKNIQGLFQPDGGSGQSQLQQDYIHKWGRMLKADLLTSPSGHCDTQISIRFADFHSWPVAAPSELTKTTSLPRLFPPGPLQDSVNKLVENYTREHPRHCLSWVTTLSHGMIQFTKAAFPHINNNNNGNKNNAVRTPSLCLSYNQLLILLHFMSVHTMQVNVMTILRGNPEMTQEDFVKALNPLLSAELLIIVDPTARAAQSFNSLSFQELVKQQLMFNTAFSTPNEVNDVFLERAIFPDDSALVLPAADQKNDTYHTSARSMSRKWCLEATIMKVMKHNGTLIYNELQARVREALLNFFVPTTSELKAPIEQLIERGFIERCADDSSVLKYVP